MASKFTSWEKQLLEAWNSAAAALEKHEVVFMEDAFVGGQHQHAAVSRRAELLQRIQSG